MFENLITSVADPGGPGHLNATTQLGYDSLGNVVTATDSNGNTTTVSYDADRRLLATTAPPPFASGSSLIQKINSYDPDGRIIAITRANGGVPILTRTTYTPTGKVQTITDPNGNVTNNSYDGDDRLASVTDPLNRITVYAYDAMSRRISIGNPGVQAAPLVQYSYTPDGLVASLTDANANTTNFTPDGFDRLSFTTYPNSSVEALSYDADSNVSTRKTRRGDTLAFGYDTLNRICTKTYATTAVACGGTSSSYLATYAYDLSNHLVGVGDNSAAIIGPAASASYPSQLSYDQLNRLLAVNWGPAPAQTTPAVANGSFNFSYDATNRRISQSGDNTWWSYPSTATNVSYTANNLNQYTAIGSVAPTYDGNGNLTNDGTFSYGYDAENRLTSASGAGLTANYAFDAQGRRKSKTVNGTTTLFVTDADNREILEYSGSNGAIQRWYAYGLGPNEALNQMNVAAGTRTTLIPDVLGSFIGSLDATSGSLTKFGYQTFGESASTTGSFRYTGQRIDPETNGLYYYRARMYMPGWGRFMQPDPAGYSAGAHLYAYVGNDPLNSTDSTGTTQDNPLVSSPDINQAPAQNFADQTSQQISTDQASEQTFASVSPPPATQPDASLSSSPTQIPLANSQTAAENVQPAWLLSPNEMLEPCLAAMGAGCGGGGPGGNLFGGGGTGGSSGGSSGGGAATPGGSISPSQLNSLTQELEAWGGGKPTFTPTPNGAPQFIFPNGWVLRFDLQPGQYSPSQGPHLNLELPGTPFNQHIPVKP